MRSLRDIGTQSGITILAYLPRPAPMIPKRLLQFPLPPLRSIGLYKSMLFRFFIAKRGK
jgi:hypothetical protein